MEFRSKVRQHGEVVKSRSQHVTTEEATKHALVLPLLTILGYDVYDPLEVIPEFDADVANRKGEKVDYAIVINGKPVVFVECKCVGKSLDVVSGQLVRYFQTVKEARFGILTNGVQYRFYTDIDDPNLMDQLPFLEFDITAITDEQIEELRKFRKIEFDKDKIHVDAEKLKHTTAITKAFAEEIEEPSDAFVKVLVEHVYPEKRFSSSKIEYFRYIAKKAIKTHLGNYVRSRLESAIADPVSEPEAGDGNSIEEQQKSEPEAKIVTTQEELNAYFIVAAILTQDKRSLGRIVYRDAQSYFSVLLDDNARKPICRLSLNARKRLYLCDAPENFKPDCKSKTFTAEKLGGVEDIYQFADRILATFRRYEDVKKG